MIRNPSTTPSRLAVAGVCALLLALAGCDRVPQPKAGEPIPFVDPRNHPAVMPVPEVPPGGMRRSAVLV